MKTKSFAFFVLSVVGSAVILTSVAPAGAAGATRGNHSAAARRAGKNSAPERSTPTVKPVTSAELAESAAAFKSAQGDASWSTWLKALTTWLSQPGARAGDPAALIKLNPCLGDLGVVVVPAGSMRVWYFPQQGISPNCVVQWSESRAATGKASRRRRKAVVRAVDKACPLSLPAGKVLQQGRAYEMRLQGSSPGKTEHARYLILTGTGGGGAEMWLASYRLTQGGFTLDDRILKSIPPFLISNTPGKIGFNGDDLEIAISPTSGDTAGGATNQGNSPPQTKLPLISYKIVLKFTGGGFTLSGKPMADTPYNAAFQFMGAIAEGRPDLAKAWLVDPSLISIPKYIGLTTGKFKTPPRILAMSGGNGHRFRAVTFGKYDLIITVGQAKDKWAVKSLFIAPPDPALQSVARGLSASETAEQSPPVK